LPCFPYVGTFLTDATFAWDGKVRAAPLPPLMPRPRVWLTLQLQGEKPMKFPERCIDIRRPIKCAGIVIGNLSIYQKRQ
jgi:hypothetical protein